SFTIEEAPAALRRKRRAGPGARTPDPFRTSGFADVDTSAHGTTRAAPPWLPGARPRAAHHAARGPFIFPSAARPPRANGAADHVQDDLKGHNRFGEQVRPGDAAGRAAAAQVRLQGGEAVVAHPHRLGQHVRPASVALAAQAAVLLPLLPVLDVEVRRVRL